MGGTLIEEREDVALAGALEVFEQRRIRHGERDMVTQKRTWFQAGQRKISVRDRSGK
jgi:hypothetical protein